MKSFLRALRPVVLIGLIACASQPEHVHLGLEECAHCRMTISDLRFAAQLQTQFGRLHSFDSVECLVRFAQANGLEEDSRFFAYGFLPPNERLAADKAFYLKSSGIPSPMGEGLSAYANEADANAQKQAHEGRIFTWKQLLEEYASLSR